MKRLTTILKLLILMMGISTSVKAQQTWDFTKTPASDVAALKAATSEWSYTESSNRYESKTAIDGAIKAGGTELEMTKGLTVKAAEKKIRIDVDKRLQLAGKNIPLTTPALKKGQVVTIVCASTGTTAVTFDQVSNLSGISGLSAANSNTVQTGTGTVAADGVVTFTCSGGSINVFSLKVEGEGEQGGGTGSDVTYYDKPSNPSVNQAILTLKNQSQKYYNTEELDAIDFDGATVRVAPKGIYGFDLYSGNVMGISFRKADNSGQGEIVNPEGAVQITDARGWMESAYVKFQKMEGAKSYNVYVQGGQYNDYTKIDQQLVRDYGSYGRADVVGLMAGTYNLKVVAVNANDEEIAATANEASGIDVRNYSREGFAFMNGYEPGAYQSDGTLKPGAKVFYITKNTAKTISTTVAGANQNPCVGLQQIIEGYEKGQDKTPIAFRFVGLVTKEDLDYVGSSEEGIQVKGRKADSELNMTFEGIGDDATIKGFGFLVRNSKSVEFRNLGIMRCMDDGLSLDTDNSNIWIHHNDFFYGPKKGGDQIKGDGACDVKSDSKLVTVSYNHFWDTGKSNMFGMKSESGPNYISYDHNWFDHSDSRHPRVRTMSVHVWNNYFDNVAKYGVGATTGASVFVENNYFLKTKKPILSSLQGTDGLGSGTFSGENGGMIKAYGNYFDRTAAHFSYYTQNNPSSKGYDAYETTSRDEQVPASEKTLVGGTTYNNFDTNGSVMYGYSAVSAEEVPALVTGYYGAGRMNHGDFTYTFQDNVGNDDTDSAYDATLGGMLDSYTSNLVGIFGDENATPGGGGDDPTPGGGDDPTPTPEGTIVCSFPYTGNFFTITGNTSNSKGTATVDGQTYSVCLKMESSTSVKFTIDKTYVMTLYFGDTETGNIKIDDVKKTSSTSTLTETLAAGSHELTKADSRNLFYIKLEPVE